MYIKKIYLNNFRNFKDISFEFPDGCIVVEGKNGVGKTNLLESVYLLCTGKSQRKSKREEMINFNSDYFMVEGDFCDNSSILNVGISFNSEKRVSFFLEHTKKDYFFDWFGKRPIISFNSEDLLLITGSPENRRKFLDLFGSYVDPLYLHLILSYRFWLQRKNSLLRVNFDDILCDVYDEKIATIGSEIFLRRNDLIGYINLYFFDLYRNISNNSDMVKIVYDSIIDVGLCSKNTCKNVFYNKLVVNRKKDREAGFSTFGPHRDDIKIFINGKDAKKYASQGQCRSLSLSLKLSSSISLEDIFNERSIFIIDDTVAELDSFRLEKFFSLIQNRGQIFLATPLGRLSRKKEYFYIEIPEVFL